MSIGPRRSRESMGIEIRRLRVRAEKAEAEVERVDMMLRNLLARCHRDGGHRTADVGLEQSTAEADRKVAQTYIDADRTEKIEAEMERLQVENAAMREALKNIINQYLPRHALSEPEVVAATLLADHPPSSAIRCIFAAVTVAETALRWLFTGDMQRAEVWFGDALDEYRAAKRKAEADGLYMSKGARQ